MATIGRGNPHIFTAGYGSLKNPQYFKSYVDHYEAQLVDVRISARSRDKAFTKSGLTSLLGGSYTHLPQFGNKNFKSSTLPTELAKPREGIELIRRYLEFQPVILLCGCWSFADCHRLDVAELLAKEFELPITHLTKKPDFDQPSRDLFSEEPV